MIRPQYPSPHLRRGAYPYIPTSVRLRLPPPPGRRQKYGCDYETSAKMRKSVVADNIRPIYYSLITNHYVQPAGILFKNPNILSGGVENFVNNSL